MQCQTGTDVWETSHQSSRWLQWRDVMLSPSAGEFEARLPADPKESCHSAFLGNQLATQSAHEDKGRLGTLFIPLKEMHDDQEALALKNRAPDLPLICLWTHSTSAGLAWWPQCHGPPSHPSPTPVSWLRSLGEPSKVNTSFHTNLHTHTHTWGIALHEKNSYKDREQLAQEEMQ